jgi:hypothetical protein
MHLHVDVLMFDWNAMAVACYLALNDMLLLQWPRCLLKPLRTIGRTYLSEYLHHYYQLAPLSMARCSLQSLGLFCTPGRAECSFVV